LQIGIRVAVYYALFALSAFAWAAAIFNLRPSTYIRTAVVTTLVSLVFVHAAMYWTVLVNFAVLLAAVLAPSGLCLMALGVLGENSEVAEVRGREGGMLLHTEGQAGVFGGEQ
jgi:hypothetical protein